MLPDGPLNRPQEVCDWSVIRCASAMRRFIDMPIPKMAALRSSISISLDTAEIAGYAECVSIMDVSFLTNWLLSTVLTLLLIAASSVIRCPAGYCKAIYREGGVRFGDVPQGVWQN